MAAPDWIALFTARPELEPPGYAETFIEMQDSPWTGRVPLADLAKASATIGQQAPPPAPVVRDATAGARASVHGEPGWWSPSGILRGERTVLVDPRGVTRLVSTKGVTLATNRANRAGGRRPAQFPSLKHTSSDP